MSSEDKSILISGLMFLALSTALAITGLFFMQALGVGVIAAVVTYVFFDTFYYVKKDWYSRQWVTVENSTNYIQLNHITTEVHYARQYCSHKRWIRNFT